MKPSVQMNEESLYLGYQIETELGDEESAEEYRIELLEAVSGLLRGQRESRSGTTK